ncbi:DUF2997 domain-containing protein (plasmid) [Phormidium sp. CLA17]|uniref:DUF2997 domain-containing protein n=1 Tax=Leptolyngbya sp. Cla-17 TaxID=2803751 RepID=UPI001490EA3D|nr:DUF2997 domain-containing protein [Leptolyngbya sp. Cla-17]MBM0745007.1 DUF2997 domain-containing protein [Leptolyngbya sp. Cla-17]
MQTPTIIITLELGQSIKTEVKGVQGEGCKALTKPLAELGTVEKFTPKPEFYDQPIVQTNTLTQSL